MNPSGMEPLVPTPLAPPSPYVNVTEGSSANGQCNIEIAKAAHMYICYGSSTAHEPESDEQSAPKRYPQSIHSRVRAMWSS